MGPAIMAVAMVVSAAGAAASGVAASHQADYQAQVAKNQQLLASQQADLINQDAATKLSEKGLQDKATMGALEATEAGKGVDINTGSPKGILASTQAISKTESRDIMRGYTMDWWNKKQQQISAQGEAELQKSKSEMAGYAGAANTASSLLGGMSKGNTEYGWFNS